MREPSAPRRRAGIRDRAEVRQTRILDDLRRRRPAAPPNPPSASRREALAAAAAALYLRPRQPRAGDGGARKQVASLDSLGSYLGVAYATQRVRGGGRGDQQPSAVAARASSGRPPILGLPSGALLPRGFATCSRTVLRPLLVARVAVSTRRASEVLALNLQWLGEERHRPRQWWAVQSRPRRLLSFGTCAQRARAPVRIKAPRRAVVVKEPAREVVRTRRRARTRTRRRPRRRRRRRTRRTARASPEAKSKRDTPATPALAPPRARPPPPPPPPQARARRRPCSRSSTTRTEGVMRAPVRLPPCARRSRAPSWTGPPSYPPAAPR